MHPVKKSKYSKILDSAIKVFADIGVENSTVSRIASEAGVADGTIYLYFENKKDILIQFAKDRGKKIFYAFEDEVEKGNNSKEMFYRLLVCHLREFTENKDLAIVFQAEISKVHSVLPEIKELSLRYRDILKSIIVKGQQEGLIKADIEPDFAKNLVSGAVNAIINKRIEKKDRVSIEECAGKMVDFIFCGLGVNADKG